MDYFLYVDPVFKVGLTITSTIHLYIYSYTCIYTHCFEKSKIHLFTAFFSIDRDSILFGISLKQKVFLSSKNISLEANQIVAHQTVCKGLNRGISSTFL